jgi:predicted nuclease with TOPRIM domain
VTLIMREQLQKRLEELKAEFEAGQTMLNELDTKRDNLRQTLLRISGAVQVLEEELTKTVEQTCHS